VWFSKLYRPFFANIELYKLIDISMSSKKLKILFSDYFKVSEKVLFEYGAFNISLLSDLPLFIDPFLLFNSKKPDYQLLHKKIIEYLSFLREKSISGIDEGTRLSLYRFKEVKQNWFGFTVGGNAGSGLGKGFAESLDNNFSKIFSDFGEIRVTLGVHLEKLCLIKEGVGRDNISDFTTNLIKDFLLDYTQFFARKFIDKKLCKSFRVSRAVFNYKTETWQEKTYFLPIDPNCDEDFVLLTPRDILTKDDSWISSEDLIRSFPSIPYAISNKELRSQINNYFRKVLPHNPTPRERRKSIKEVLIKYPVLIDYYIRKREDVGNRAQDISLAKVEYSEDLYLNQFPKLASLLNEKTNFYKIEGDSYTETLKRVKYLKHVIEDTDGYKFFYDKFGNPIRRESDLKILFRLVWCGSDYCFSTEVDDGRGPADGKTSMGSKDKTITELKLASNTKLEQNLLNQTEVYQKASGADKSVKVIIGFTADELKKVQLILKRLDLADKENIVVIDARRSNKPSGSKAK